MKEWMKGALTAAVEALIIGVVYYFWLPPFHVRSGETWLFMIMALAMFGGVEGVRSLASRSRKKFADKVVRTFRSGSVFMSHSADKQAGWTARMFLLLAAAGAVIGALGLLFSAELFHAKAYAEILTVQEDCSFEEDLAETVSTDAIAIMDTDSARMLGNRKIGSLSALVSQYDVSENYSQINYRGMPMKVAALDYAGFFKYMKNRGTGIPGYVMVSPVDMSARYVELEKPMRYVPSAAFSDNLYRHIRTRFKTQMIRDIWFEVDEEGNPYYVAAVCDHTIGLFGGEDVIGAILVNPVSGDMEYYDSSKIPEWVDVVYDGDLLCEQYNYYGELRNGFWNAQFSAEGCKVTTEDYGYIAMGDDIWIYTGVTSVNSDASNIGFVLMNERTKEAKFYIIAGADEASAMTAAEGEVQQYRYKASFPSLINIDGYATYIMVLKDSGGLVKMYAAVNAEQYNLVTTATDQKECIEKYRRMMASGDPENEPVPMEADKASGSGAVEQTVDRSEFVEQELTVKRLEKIVVDGNTYLYLMAEDGKIYHARYIDVLSMMDVAEGDTVRVFVYEDQFLTQ